MINRNQIDAAALYWVKVIKEEIKPQPQSQNRAQPGPFISVMSANNRKIILSKLEEKEPLETQFMEVLSSLIEGREEDSIKLELDIEPKGLLNTIIKKIGIHPSLFPRLNLLMEFNQQGNFLINGKEEESEAFLKTHKAEFSCQ